MKPKCRNYNGKKEKKNENNSPLNENAGVRLAHEWKIEIGEIVIKEIMILEKLMAFFSEDFL